MKFIVNGAKGRMGAQIVALLKKEDCPHELLAGVDINAAEGDGYFKSLSCVTEKADCIIDFSHHSATKEICEYAVKMGVPVLFATTGQTEEELEMYLSMTERIAERAAEYAKLSSDSYADLDGSAKNPKEDNK